MSFCWRCSSISSNSLRQDIVKYVDRTPVVNASTVTIRFSRTLRDPVSAAVMNLMSTHLWLELHLNFLKLNN